MRRGQALRRGRIIISYLTTVNCVFWHVQKHNFCITVGWRRSVIKEILELRSLGMISIRNACKNWPIADQPGKDLISSSLHWRRRQWHPTPVLLPGKSHGRRRLVGCSPWGRWVRPDWATSLSLFTFMPWRRKWQPTPVFLPRESQGRGSLVGCRLWGRTESDMTEAT